MALSLIQQKRLSNTGTCTSSRLTQCLKFSSNPLLSRIGKEIGVDPNVILETSHGRRSIDTLRALGQDHLANWECTFQLLLLSYYALPHVEVSVTICAFQPRILFLLFSFLQYFSCSEDAKPHILPPSPEMGA